MTFLLHVPYKIKCIHFKTFRKKFSASVDQLLPPPSCLQPVFVCLFAI